MLIVAFCKIQFVAENFKFLKTVAGKGFFNIFVASMFLVGDRGLWGYIMCGGLLFCGIFFILVAYACIKGVGYDSVNGEDISPEKMKK